ncbi:pyridoxal phosphate-dependent transferase [Blastocladiella britannica]|nr:pyridoxal phosphate-dependent transferase [Blastocladiella britannica]
MHCTLAHIQKIIMSSSTFTPIPFLPFDPSRASPEQKLAAIRKNVIGHDTLLTNALGLKRPLIYCDWFASGRSLACIEDAVRSHVLPYYANTHTTTTATARRTTELREWARRAVAAAVGLDHDDDEYAVIFTGSGSTSAILHLVHTLRLHDRDHWTSRATVTASCCRWPVVFVSIAEHHSNLLPWRESCATVVVVPMDPATGNREPDLAFLEAKLREYADAPLKIGSFSAGSNITGVPVQADAITRVLHRHGALALFDYAGVGPYVPIAMRPSSGVQTHKDAIFLSPHKLIGGPGTPGVLVARRSFFTQHAAPSRPGGGSVAFVTQNATQYLCTRRDVEEREEAGTPAIVESIRCGMVFALKSAVSDETIGKREHAVAKRVLARLAAIPAVVVVGDTAKERVPVVSVQVRASSDGRFLHHDFVSTVLNDLFGIQTRGGCMCAGPYAQSLLNASPEEAAMFGDLLSDDPAVRAQALAAANARHAAASEMRKRSSSSLDSAYASAGGSTGGCVLLAAAATAAAEPPATSSSLVFDESRPLLAAAKHSQLLQSRDSGLDFVDTPTPLTVPRYSVYKPGFLRLSFNYFTSDKEIDRVLSALEWVARHGRSLLAYYAVDPISGTWTVRKHAYAAVAAGYPSWRSVLSRLVHGHRREAMAYADWLVAPKRMRALPGGGRHARAELAAIEGGAMGEVLAKLRWWSHPADVVVGCPE